MRSLRLAVRLALRNLRRRPAQGALLLLTLTIATGVLGVATSVYGSADAPWDRVWRATNGFHVSLGVYHPPDEPANRAFVDELRRRSEQLATAPGVTGVSGPWTHLDGSIEVAGGSEDLTAEVRDPGPYEVDQPLVTGGRWLGEGGGVVLESGLAATLQADPGDTVVIQGRPFPVRGVASTVSRGRFPLSRPAQVWVTPETARQLHDLGMTEEGFELQLRLADPDDAAGFVAAHRSLEASDPSSAVIAYMETWRQRRADSHSDIDILAGTVRGGRADRDPHCRHRGGAHHRPHGHAAPAGRHAQGRRCHPTADRARPAVEHLAIAAGAIAIGLGIGRLLAPRIAATSVTVLGRPEPPPLTWTRVAIVAAVACAVVLLGTIRPALRGIRQSTLRSLAAGPRPPRRPGRLARLAANLGVPLPGVLGMRSAWRRPGRLLTNAAGLLLGWR
jgi:putative ABC transport system permease protein